MNPTPYRKWLTVTKSDTVDLPAGCRGLYISGAGNIVLVDMDDTTVTLAVTVGQLLTFAPKRVNSTNTTATAVALY